MISKAPFQRLTFPTPWREEYNPDGTCRGIYGYDSNRSHKAIVERLGEYEDLGLDPYVIKHLLEKKLPRLVTYDDFQQPPAYDGVLPCWKEAKSPTRRSGWVAIVYGKALQDTEMGVARYWTGVPTEEQRRELAWPNV